MIDLYSFDTPNGRKVSILLEELAVPYRAHKVDILKGEQFSPAFLAISPNNKIPAIVDTEGPGGAPLSVFETGAILVYLAEKYGQFLPADPVQRVQTLQWLFWQVGGVGPMFGQAGHFVRFAKEDLPYAKERYLSETRRLLGVLATQLGDSRDYIIGDTYTIADIAVAPWIDGLGFYGLSGLIDEHPPVRAWLERVKARPAVQRGWNAPFTQA